MSARRLIFIGGGHAHLAVLRAAAARHFDAELVLVSLSTQQAYSGMMPGQLRGAYTEAELTVDLPSLCRAAGARFVEGEVTRIDASHDTVHVLAGGESLHGSCGSLDIGAALTGHELPGVRSHAFASRPLPAWRRLVARAAALAGDSRDGTGEVTREVKGDVKGDDLRDDLRRGGAADVQVSCCVVGGGAAGTELALALATRLRANGRTADVTLLSASPEVPTGFPPRVVSRVRSILARRDIALVTNAMVQEVTAHDVLLRDGRRIPSQLTVWATGPAAPALVRASDLPMDPAGFFAVDATLRAENGAALWGAGDCIAMASASWMTRSGVYAVRAAPVLAHNLRAVAAGLSGTRTFVPQQRTMFILDTGDGSALLCREPLVWQGRAAQWLKESIDRRFVRQFRV